MFNICCNCGEYRPDKLIDSGGSYATCPVCKHKHAFLRLPLLSVTGPSGAGKSCVCRHLVGGTQDIVILEGDILWRKEFANTRNGTISFRNLCLNICKNVGQSGRPVLLCASASPGEYESCVEYRYFTGVHYLALTCRADVMRQRLKDRPDWRNTSSEEFIRKHIEWNQWFLEHPHEQDVTLLDTTDVPVEKTVTAVQDWIRDKLKDTRQMHGKTTSG